MQRCTVRSPESKLMSLEQAMDWRGALRASGRTLVVTNGCFDLIHRGHVEYLARAREHGDALLVAINSDASVAAIKGPGRPVIAEVDRAYLIASLEAVDAVVVFSTPKATDLLRALLADVYVKGGDYTEATLVQEEYLFLQSVGCRVEFVPLISGISTTELIQRVRRDAEPRRNNASPAR